jgi:large subunit ribosomal protein L15
LNELALVDADVIDLVSLKKRGIVPGYIKQAKVIKSGVIEKSVTIQGLAATAGAKAAIEAAGGKVED